MKINDIVYYKKDKTDFGIYIGKDRTNNFEQDMCPVIWFNKYNRG